MKTFPVLLCIALIAGCSTPQYRAQEAQCKLIAEGKYPEKYMSGILTTQELQQVPTGDYNCDSNVRGSTISTRCTQGKKTELVPVQKSIVYDTNEMARIEYTKRCTEAACIRAYGNSTCKLADRDPNVKPIWATLESSTKNGESYECTYVFPDGSRSTFTRSSSCSQRY
jgi:hypothetical protein